MIFDDPTLVGVRAALRELIGLTALFWGWGDTELLMLLLTGSKILCLLWILLSFTWLPICLLLALSISPVRKEFSLWSFLTWVISIILFDLDLSLSRISCCCLSFSCLYWVCLSWACFYLNSFYCFYLNWAYFCRSCTCFYCVWRSSNCFCWIFVKFCYFSSSYL